MAQNRNSTIIHPTKIAWCSVCDQGWIHIFKDKLGNYPNLYMECDECYACWTSATDVLGKEKVDADLALYNIETWSVVPSVAEIRQYGWEKYLINNIED